MADPRRTKSLDLTLHRKNHHIEDRQEAEDQQGIEVTPANHSNGDNNTEVKDRTPAVEDASAVEESSHSKVQSPVEVSSAVETQEGSPKDGTPAVEERSAVEPTSPPQGTSTAGNPSAVETPATKAEHKDGTKAVEQAPPVEASSTPKGESKQVKKDKKAASKAEDNATADQDTQVASTVEKDAKAASTVETQPEEKLKGSDEEFPQDPLFTPGYKWFKPPEDPKVEQFPGLDQMPSPPPGLKLVDFSKDYFLTPHKKTTEAMRYHAVQRQHESGQVLLRQVTWLQDRYQAILENNNQLAIQLAVRTSEARSHKEARKKLAKSFEDAGQEIIGRINECKANEELPAAREKKIAQKEKELAVREAKKAEENKENEALTKSFEEILRDIKESDRKWNEKVATSLLSVGIADEFISQERTRAENMAKAKFFEKQDELVKQTARVKRQMLDLDKYVS